MGLFSTVKAVLPCERCHARFEAEVQFYTDDDSELPIYAVGDRVPLPADSLYEGITHIYCRPCRRAHYDASHSAHFLRLALEVETGPTVAKQGRGQLSPDEIRALEHSKHRFGGEPYFEARLKDLGVEIINWDWHGHRGAVHRELIDKGWPTGGDTDTEDIWVAVTSEGTVAVRFDPPPPREEPSYPAYASVSEMLVDQGAALNRLRSQKLIEAFTQWCAVPRATRGWFLDGSVALRFEQQILVIWPGSQELKLKLLGSESFPDLDGDLMLATTLWRKVPWLDFFPLYNQKLNGLSFHHGEAGWSARLTLEQVTLSFFSEAGELSWKTEPLGTAGSGESNALIF